MYFATYIEGNTQKIGIVNKEKTGVIPFSTLYKQYGEQAGLGPCPENMIAFIEMAQGDLVKQLSCLIREEDLDSLATPLEKVKLQAPIPYPRRNIFCVGKNYMDHAKEVGAVFGNLPQYPTFFSKVAYPAIGDGDYIDSHPGIVKKLDYEVELAVIIGKEGKNISKEDAENYVFGYTILNDISARELQKRHEQWHKGKSLDTFCPMGPYLVHKNEILSPVCLDITCKVNGELRQNSNTKNLIFDIPTLIHVLSQGFTLKAGDVIATGTPAGVGLGFEPEEKYLHPGDVVECYIEKIGTLKNIIK